MLSLISKILGSKFFSVASLILIVILGVSLLVLFIQNKVLDKKRVSLEGKISQQESLIKDQKTQIEALDMEVKYLKTGISVLEKYDQSKEDICKDGESKKTELLETALSKEEVKDWWNTPIPTDVLNLINGGT